MRRGYAAIILSMIICGMPMSQVTGQEPSMEDRLKALEASAGSGHNAWMLACSALVLFMTLPGLSLFYGGLVRKKNVLSVMMQCIFLAGLMTILWALLGYSLAFSGSNPWIGDLGYAMMRNVAMVGGDGPDEGVIPRLTHMVFQGMFFIITPALICGAFAERMKFGAMSLFMAFWGLLVYCPLCHWVWDADGILFRGSASSGPFGGGALDFAGGTVVHISAGISALVCALMLGRRVGYGSEDMRPHNLTYTVMGAGMLWVGWFGFNAGSALASNDLASSAFVATHFSAAAGAVAWAGMEWVIRRKPSVLGAASGAVAGLVCITPGSGFVQPIPAFVFGALAGIFCYLACWKLKAHFGYDDSLDAFGVHGIGGILGAILTGVFATKDVNTAGENGLYYAASTGLGLLAGQAVAILVTVSLSIVATAIILKVVDLLVGLRVEQTQERMGLDITDHGEEGYIF
jgi:ammonium transporter, Amt family